MRRQTLRWLVGLCLAARATLTCLGAEEHHPRRIIIKPKPAQDLRNLHAQMRSRVLKTYPRFGGLQVLEIPEGAAVEQVRTAFERSGLVEYAGFDQKRSAKNFPTPNENTFSNGTLWGLHNTGQNSGTADADIDAPEAWHYRTHANEVIVAVVDTGVRYTHEDLRANMWRNPGETGQDANGADKATNGIDDDQNGYVDDVHGINAITGSGDPSEGDGTYQGDGHGTHVAGTIGAVGDNGLGVVGVAWRVRIMALKFLGNNGGWVSQEIECIDYAISKGASIINASFGGDYDSAEAEVMQVLANAGIIVTAAAGNSNTDTDVSPKYPCSLVTDNIVSVAATDRTDSRYNLSNYGLISVDLAAPGKQIESTWFTSDTAYAAREGTSHATPYVTGAMALLKSQFPAESYQQLINRLFSSTEPISSFSGLSQTGGRLNLRQALTSTSSAPANDLFSNSFKLVIPSGHAGVMATGNNIDATEESGEPNHAGNYGGKSVWWHWTAPSATPVTIRTKSSSFNTLLAVYTGNLVSSLTPVESNMVSDNCGDLTQNYCYPGRF